MGLNRGKLAALERAVGQKHGDAVDDGVAAAASVAAHGSSHQRKGLVADRADEPLEGCGLECGLEG